MSSRRDSSTVGGLLPTEHWNPYYPSPPPGISFVVREGYLPVREGDEQRTRWIPLIYDKIRGDLARMSRVSVDRAAVEKVGPIYRGVLDSGGEPFVFSMSGERVLTCPVQKNKRQEAWRKFEELQDKEYAASVAEERKKWK